MKKAEREIELIRLWLSRPQVERTPNDVLFFYAEIQQNFSHLLRGMHGDPYQSLKSVLRNHIRE